MAGGGDKEKKEKKPKDPNAPKRPLSAYQYWMKEHREDFKEDGMSPQDIMRACGAGWREVTERSRWEKMAAEDKERYQREKEEYEGDK